MLKKYSSTLNCNGSSMVFGILLVAVFALYSQALNGPFLFDDTNNIQYNSAVHLTELSLSGLQKAAQGHRPVAMLSFALDHYLHGLSPFWFRISNLLIHVCAATVLHAILCSTNVLLFTTEEETQRYRWLPIMSTLLWAAHPLQIQSVVYIVQRMNSLAGLFLLLALLSYVKARLASSLSGTIIFAFLCIIAAGLSIGSKPNAAILPFLILLYEYFFFQKRKCRALLPVLAAILLFMAVAGYYVLDGHPFVWCRDTYNVWYANNAFTPVQRVLTEFRVVMLYLSLLALPHPSRLNIDHDILFSTSLLSPPSTAWSLAAIMALLLTGVLRAAKMPLFSFGIFWFFASLLIESTVIPLDLMFEHRNYIPSMMLIPGIVFLWLRFFSWNAVKIIFTAVIALHSLWTCERNAVWRSGIALWQDSAEKSPNKTRPHQSLAYYLQKEQRYSDALQQYKRAEELSPNDAALQNNIGGLYAETGDLQAALEHYAAALRIQPDFKETYNNLGAALCRLGEFEQAIVHYEKALALDPHYAAVHANLANALANIGKINPAMQHYDQAIALDADKNNMAMHYYNKSILLLRTNRLAEAEQALQQVLLQKQDFKEAYNNLGVAQEKMGKMEAAWASYQNALKIDPNFQDARQNAERLKRR